MPLRIFSPASATWRRSASVPITKAVRPERVSASRCWSAPPTVTTSDIDALMPIFHSRAT